MDIRRGPSGEIGLDIDNIVGVGVGPGEFDLVEHLFSLAENSKTQERNHEED